MILFTDYYKFTHQSDCPSKTRLDCISSTGSYPDFECLRNKAGKLFIHCNDTPVNFGGDIHRKAQKAISKTKNISSIYKPDITSNTGYGDTKNTADALLFLHNPDYSEIEIFIARGYKNCSLNIWQNYIEGEYADNMQHLRSRAIVEVFTSESS